MRLFDLKQKEVVNIITCRRLGAVLDVQMDLDEGTVEKIIVAGPSRIYSFLGSDSEYLIDYPAIRQVGDDIILVEVDEDECLHKRKLK